MPTMIIRTRSYNLKKLKETSIDYVKYIIQALYSPLQIFLKDIYFLKCPKIVHTST